MALPASRRLGPYEIVAQIGAGGMGEVYRARDTRLERTVAIKVLPTHLADRAKRLDAPADLPVLSDRETLARVLASFGAKLVREVSDPTVIAVFRLAIAEVAQAPEVARALNSIGREASRAALRKIMARARASGLLTGLPAALAEQFAGLLWRDLLVSLLLGVAGRPNHREIARRARDAAAAFLQLHPL